MTLENATTQKGIDGVIYKVTNTINRKVYIGMTTRDFRTRKNEHRLTMLKPETKTYFYSALRKYSWENFIWEIIDKSSDFKELCERESYWIKYYNSFGENGYNHTCGGEGSTGYTHSKEFKEKCSERMTESHRLGHYEGLQRKGSAHPKAVLNETNVLKIKDMIIDRIPRKIIAQTFDVSTAAIGDIKNGTTWRHIIPEEDKVKMLESTPTYLLEIEVIEIRDLLVEGKLTLNEISLVVGISAPIISKIRSGKTYTHIITKEDLERMREGGGMHLIEEEVIEIKDLLVDSNLTQTTIAERYNIHDSTISNIKNGKTWSHIFTEEELKLMRTTRKKKKILTKKEVVEIVQLLKEDNLTNEEIGIRYDVSSTAIVYIGDGSTWKDIVSNDDIKAIEENRIRNKEKNKGRKSTRTKLTKETFSAIEKLLAENAMSQSDIANKFNVSSGKIHRIKNGKKVRIFDQID